MSIAQKIHAEMRYRTPYKDGSNAGRAPHQTGSAPLFGSLLDVDRRE